MQLNSVAKLWVFSKLMLEMEKILGLTQPPPSQPAQTGFKWKVTWQPIADETPEKCYWFESAILTSVDQWFVLVEG